MVSLLLVWTRYRVANDLRRTPPLNPLSNLYFQKNSARHFLIFVPEHSSINSSIETIVYFAAGSMVLSGLSVFFIAMLDNSTQTLIFSCVFGGITVIGWDALDVVQVELYPTEIRWGGQLDLFNSLWPRDKKRHDIYWPPFVQVMACCLIDT